MQFSLFKLGALVAMAQTISAANLHIETTHPPANKYKAHCTVIVTDAFADGCKGSSSPFPGGCGDNLGVKKASICGSNTITVDWNHGTLQYSGDNTQAHCTLSSTHQGGKCDTSDPDRYPQPTSAGPGLSAINALLGITPVVAGLLL